MEAEAKGEVKTGRDGSEVNKLIPPTECGGRGLYKIWVIVMKQYLVSEWIPEDCDATIVEVLTAESKDFYIWWSSNETL